MTKGTLSSFVDTAKQSTIIQLNILCDKHVLLTEAFHQVQYKNSDHASSFVERNVMIFFKTANHAFRIRCLV